MGIGRKPTHGMSKSLTYTSWVAMKKRCYYPKTNDYWRYGGSGIQVCERWRVSFEMFLRDMGERPSSQYSLDRIDGTQNYEPSNCRWATASEQARNRIKPRLAKESRICQNCQSDFSVERYIVKRGEGLFCSLRCSAVFRQIERAKATGHRRLVLSCPVCGGEMHKKPYMVAHRKTVTCSLRCRVLLKKGLL